MLKKAKAAHGTASDSGEAQGPRRRRCSIRRTRSGSPASARSSRAQQEGMKMFETLVKQGEELERRTRQAAAETAAAARGAATAKAKEMQQMAGGTWDKLEQVFEDRVARALSKLGVYTQNDVQKLADARRRAVGGGQRAAEGSRARSAGRRRASRARSAAAKPASARKAPRSRKSEAQQRASAASAALACEARADRPATPRCRVIRG